MDRKIVLFLIVLILAVWHAEADFFFNHPRINPPRIESGLKCVPGRTIINMGSSSAVPSGGGRDYDEYSDEDYGRYRRSHMNFKTDDTSCRICICSVEGKDEYCSNRPAKNVHECMRMSALMDKFARNDPFDHEKSLAFRIRRDYIWHNDEIPYNAKAKCFRGHSYYSNSISANDTDIDIDSEVESLLDYTNNDTCYYCLCSVDGRAAQCLSRKLWFCEYFRTIRQQDHPRAMYASRFEQDRPAYFRTLSWRLRRAMDTGMFDLVESGGDALCCGHPNGHRRHLHHQVRDKIRLMKKKINKENLMDAVDKGDYVDFVVNNDK